MCQKDPHEGLVYIRCRGPLSLTKEHWIWAVNHFQFCGRCQALAKRIRSMAPVQYAEQIHSEDY
jgi:hypothetical protein